MASKPWWSVGLSGGGQGSDGPNGGPTKPPASTGGGGATTTTTTTTPPTQTKGGKMPKWLQDWYKNNAGALPPAATGYQGGTMPAGGGMPGNLGANASQGGGGYSPVNVGGLTGYVPFTARGQTQVPSWLQARYGNMLLGPWDYGLNPYGAGIFNNYGQPIGTPAPANNKRVTNRQWNFFQHGGMNPDKVTRWVGPYKTPGAGVPHWGGGNGGGGGGKNKSTGWQEGINQLAL